ncbi:hypothetical protein CRYPA_666 [uncultured Candidatus Thioglobus sp.]|nr:hypothetical protein CRYPA_666 [uncultured Candidatus Thioglobus sp.]
MDTDTYPEAKFISTSFVQKEGKFGILKGNLTLHGITKAIEIKTEFIGEGKDPWGWI